MSLFDQLDRHQQQWIEDYANETIEAAEFAEFQDVLEASDTLRAALRQYLALDSNLCENLGAASATSDEWEQGPAPSPIAIWRPVTMAAAAAFIFGGALMFLWKPQQPLVSALASPPQQGEPQAKGYAVIHRIQSSASFSAGDSLGAGPFVLPDGSAQLHFFCGARMTVEGPAELDIQSAWKTVCSSGNLHVQVPPAARGFVVTTPGSEIVDLGTEFGLQVLNGDSTVEVLDGKIEIHHGQENKRVLISGEARFLPRTGASEQTEAHLSVPNLSRLLSQYDAGRQAAFDQWLANSDALAADKRLIAYYNFQGLAGGRVANLANGGARERDGAVILADPVFGRWPGVKNALEFRRPGSRARVNIPGEFSAFTFAAWVRIDSLDRRYNALFMSDAYETGEPHWQIENSGRLMISVMVDEDAPNPNHENGKGVHEIYYSPSIWDQSMSGKWVHLASVYDPANRQASHYVNGEQVSHQKIEDWFFIDKLRIGNAEIGNWGEPFRRNEPFFAIRNLNGRIDELTLLNAALSAEEVRELWQQSK
jgi:hypothetical protein